MSDEKSQQQTSTESTVAGAAKTGKAISNIAKGAAAGGAPVSYTHLTLGSLLRNG